MQPNAELSMSILGLVKMISICMVAYFGWNFLSMLKHERLSTIMQIDKHILNFRSQLYNQGSEWWFWQTILHCCLLSLQVRVSAVLCSLQKGRRSSSSTREVSTGSVKELSAKHAAKLILRRNRTSIFTRENAKQKIEWHCSNSCWITQ